ncbi:MAG TPA: hypothetical protein VN939_12180 [Chthoniobacterales bacterium]|nr:hypothetical protein [Chthoniobacterales bacterium]
MADQDSTANASASAKPTARQARNGYEYGKELSNFLNSSPIGYWLLAIGYYDYEDARVTPV